MPTKARRTRKPGKEPRTGSEDKRARVRELLTLCLDLLGSERAASGPTTAAVAPAVPVPAEVGDFSEREVAFMRLVSDPANWPYPYIAWLMHLKLPTLHYMRRKLFEKLGVDSRLGLVLKVRELSLG